MVKISPLKKYQTFKYYNLNCAGYERLYRSVLGTRLVLTLPTYRSFRPSTPYNYRDKCDMQQNQI